MSTETRPRANARSASKEASPGGANDTQRAMPGTPPNEPPPAGADSRSAMRITTTTCTAPSGPNSHATRALPATITPSSRGSTSRPTGLASTPNPSSSDGDQSPHATEKNTTPSRPASRGDSTTGHQMRSDAQSTPVAGSNAAPGPAAIGPTAPKRASLLDPALAFAADILDDLERVRIANENRLRQLTRSGEDSDGEERGFGLDESHPDVARLSAMVATLRKVEHDAELELNRKLRKHALGPWVKAQKGVGEKQAARLLAVIGDPYINSAKGEPRTVSALWAYCGLHVLRTGQTSIDTRNPHAGPDQLPGQARYDDQSSPAGNGGDLGQGPRDTHLASAGVAPKRRRGELANWSTLAKTRAYLVAESCVKQLNAQCRALQSAPGDHAVIEGAALRHTDDCACSPYRVVYDHGRAKYATATHPADCPQCGPAGKPALVGSPLSAGHQHARAMRLVMKAMLRDLWREARRLHLELTA